MAKPKGIINETLQLLLVRFATGDTEKLPRAEMEGHDMVPIILNMMTSHGYLAENDGKYSITPLGIKFYKKGGYDRGKPWWELALYLLDDWRTDPPVDFLKGLGIVVAEVIAIYLLIRCW